MHAPQRRSGAPARRSARTTAAAAVLLALGVGIPCSSPSAIAVRRRRRRQPLLCGAAGRAPARRSLESATARRRRAAVCASPRTRCVARRRRHAARVREGRRGAPAAVERAVPAAARTCTSARARSSAARNWCGTSGRTRTPKACPRRRSTRSCGACASASCRPAASGRYIVTLRGQGFRLDVSTV